MEGVLYGGWEYIEAAYAIVWGGMLIYGVTVILRRRAAEREAQAERTKKP